MSGPPQPQISGEPRFLYGPRRTPPRRLISARAPAVVSLYRSSARTRIVVWPSFGAMGPISPERREYYDRGKWPKDPSTISGALNGHRSLQKRPRLSPLGPPTLPGDGGELWGSRASGGSDALDGKSMWSDISSVGFGIYARSCACVDLDSVDLNRRAILRLQVLSGHRRRLATPTRSLQSRDLS